MRNRCTGSMFVFGITCAQSSGPCSNALSQIPSHCKSPQQLSSLPITIIRSPLSGAQTAQPSFLQPRVNFPPASGWSPSPDLMILVLQLQSPFSQALNNREGADFLPISQGQLHLKTNENVGIFWYKNREMLWMASSKMVPNFTYFFQGSK